MNKIDMKDFIDGDNFALCEMCIEPSEELVKRWMGLMTFSSPKTYHTSPSEYEGLREHKIGNPICVRPVLEKDYLEAAVLFEAIERYCKSNKLTHERTKWIMTNVRKALTSCPIMVYNDDKGNVIEVPLDEGYV